jgi:hypothetical protein
MSDTSASASKGGGGLGVPGSKARLIALLHAMGFDGPPLEAVQVRANPTLREIVKVWSFGSWQAAPA